MVPNSSVAKEDYTLKLTWKQEIFPTNAWKQWPKKEDKMAIHSVAIRPLIRQKRQELALFAGAHVCRSLS